MITPDIIRHVLLAIAIVLVFGAIYRKFYGVVGYLIIMVTRPGLHYQMLADYRIELIVGLFIITIVILSPGNLQKINLESARISKNLLILLAVMGLSMLQAFSFSHSSGWMIEFGKVIVFYFMITLMADNVKDLKFFLWVFASLMVFTAYDAIHNFHTGNIVYSMGGSRINYATASEGMGSGHVALANMALQGMPFIWFFTVSSASKLVKIAGAVLFSICFYGIVISGSRGGFVGIVVLYLCILYFTKKRSLVIGVGVVVVLVFPLLTTEGYWGYIRTILDLFTGSSGISGSSRIDGLRHGIEMLIKKPLLGVGPGCYPLARKAWFGWGLWAHNHYGELIGELGIIGTVVWAKFFLSYFKKAISTMKDTHDSTVHAICLSIIVATIVRLVMGMGSHSVYIFFWYMTAAVMAALDRIMVNQETTTITT
ncbi:MAG: hypothetical protein VR64_23490 [Desulfatitalea sp. BRH_c12]|nr:MAG: hypothetical protein VR64_23490 [Desulfatitalea sp. BRH_c12]